MTPTLPAPVARYYAAATPAEVVACFAENGVAMDERRTHHGLAALLRWREEVARIDFTQRILAVRPAGDAGDGPLTVTCEVAGAFPGSPVRLDHRFTLDGDRIARLEIM